MKYKAAHPRKVRGKAVHQTFDEKMQEILNKKYVTADGRVMRGREIYSKNERPRILREAIESTYLVPKAEPFVETGKIRNVGERVKLWLKAGYPVHLIGPTGCGKTSLAMHVAKELKRPVVWINGDEQVTTTDLIGGYSQVEAESLRDKYIHNVFKSRDILKADWVDNPLALACKYGYTLVYNEFARTRPGANNVLLSVFEEGILELPTKFGEERYVKVHPEFKAILTSNSVEYAGIHRPQDALLDRMIGIYMDYYDFNTEVKIVRAHTGIPKAEAERIVGVVRALRERLQGAQKPGTRACIMAAHGLKHFNGHGEDALEELLLDVVASKTPSIADLEMKQRMIMEELKAGGQQ